MPRISSATYGSTASPSTGGGSVGSDARDLLGVRPVARLRRRDLVVDDHHGDAVDERVLVPLLADERLAARLERANGRADRRAPARAPPRSASPRSRRFLPDRRHAGAKIASERLHRRPGHEHVVPRQAGPERSEAQERELAGEERAVDRALAQEGRVRPEGERGGGGPTRSAGAGARRPPSGRAARGRAACRPPARSPSSARTCGPCAGTRPRCSASASHTQLPEVRTPRAGRAAPSGTGTRGRARTGGRRRRSPSGARRRSSRCRR